MTGEPMDEDSYNGSDGEKHFFNSDSSSDGYSYEEGSDDGIGDDAAKVRAKRACISCLEQEIKNLDGGCTKIKLTYNRTSTLDAWMLEKEHPVLNEFLHALRSNRTLTSLTIELYLLRPEQEAKEMALYDTLGAALGEISSLRTVKVRQHRLTGAAQAVANVLRHLRHVRSFSWILHSDSEIGLNDFGVLRDALIDKHSIKNASLQRTGRDTLGRPCEFDSAAIGHLLTALGRLPRLRKLFINDCIADCNAPVLANVIRLPSLMDLELLEETYLGYDAAKVVCAAIGASRIELLKIYQCSFTKDYPKPSGAATSTAVVPVVLALRAPSLRKLTLDLDICSRASAVALVQALARSKVEELYPQFYAWHGETSKMIARALCLPSLKSLKPYDSEGCLYANEISLHLKQCPRLETFCFLTTRDYISLDDFLAGCLHCYELQDLKLPHFGRWTAETERAVSNCIAALPRLRRLSVTFYCPMNNHERPFFASPSLLAACRANSSMEELSLMNSRELCPQFRYELWRILDQNKDVRVHRKRFESLMVDAGRSGVMARALSRVQWQPHRLYVAVSCCMVYLM